MSFFDSLFGPSETKTTTKVDYPDWVENASKKNYNLAETIASRPYTPYPFERVAGFTGDQSKAMSMLRNMAPMAKSAMGPIDLPRMFEDVGRGGSRHRASDDIAGFPPGPGKGPRRFLRLSGRRILILNFRRK